MADTRKQHHVPTTIDPAQLRVMHQNIDRMVSKIMPPIPHLISVPTTTPYRQEFPHENTNTPFAPWEVKHLQYMTLVPFGSRGVAQARGDWEDEINGQSPNDSSLRSGTTTPRSQREQNNKPRVKMSLADYKSGKRPAKTQDLSHVRAENAANGTFSESHRPDSRSQRDSSDEMRPSHHGLPRKPDLELTKSQTYTTSPTKPSKSSLVANGYGAAGGSRARADDRHELSPRPSPRPVHELPPKPSDYSRHEPHMKQLKRPLTDATSPIEKKSRLEVNGVRPSKSSESLARISGSKHERGRSTSLSSKPPVAQSRSPEYRGDRDRERDRDRKTISTKQKSKNIKTDGTDILPPLLSPLPAGLTSPDERNGFDPPLKSLKGSKADQPTPPKSPRAKGYTAMKKRQDSPEPLVLPRLLSPELPDIVEQELARMKSTSTSSPSSVEAVPKGRAETTTPVPVRRAEKTAAKKPREESVPKPTRVGKPSLIIKIKYKKRHARDIERILKMPSATSRQFRQPHHESHNDAGSKRRSQPSEDPEPAPVSKHNRLSEDHAEPQRPVTPAFKSPSRHPAVKITTTSTPKKSEGAKSVAMRKVDSSDSQVRTPHLATGLSTSASVEKARSNGGEKGLEHTLALRKEFDRYNDLGTRLKRHMDELLQNKQRKAVPPTESERHLGVVVALESIIAYMIAFYTNDRIRAAESRPNDGKMWNNLWALLAFVIERCRPFPELLALALGLAGVCREECQRVLVTANNKALFEDMIRNARIRDAAWRDFHAQIVKADLQSIQPFGALGPWTAPDTAAGMIVKGLARWADEMRLDWKKRVDY